MAKLNDVFGGNFLKADDLQGKNVTVTIESVEVKEFDDGKKLILRFSGKDRGLVCNRTNASIIEEVLGSSDTDHWEGRKIILTTKKVEFQGKLVPAIRVSLDPPKSEQARKPEPPPEPADQDGDDGSEIPF